MTNKEAIAILKPLFEQCKGTNECLGYIEHYFSKDEELALDLAIQALEERPQGKWIKKVDDVGFISHICSECGAEIESENPCDDKFCFNCGADLRGEEE